MSVGREIPGYKGFVSKFATLQRYQNDPIGTLHAIKALEKIGFDNVLAFERNMSKEFPNIAPIKTKSVGGVEKGRRVDAVIKINTNIELKGSSKAVGSYNLSKAAELEFLNDAIYFARAGQKFEWHIAKQLDISAAQARMKKLLGDGNIPDGLDDRLLSNVNDLRKTNPAAADQMEAGLIELFNELNNGKIIKAATYLD